MTAQNEGVSIVQLKPGQRLRSQVCSTEVIVVRLPSGEIDLRCGGTSMVAVGSEVAEGQSPQAGLDTGSQLGKRYTSESDDTLEILVTKAGAGTLSDGSVVLVLKEAKPLPASD
jgi:hypothetical protein